MSTQSTRQMPDQTDNPSTIPAFLEGLGILVVDDQSDHLELMREILFKAGYQEVLGANSGQEALDILEQNPGIGLVLLDLVMPGMNGYEVCRKIKSNPVTQDICIIVVTGGAIQVEEAILKSFEAGAIDFITKPLSRFDLLARSQSSLTLFYEKQQNLYQAGELLLREEKYRSLFESSIDAIFVLNPADLVITDANLSAETLLGYEIEELIGRSFTSLCPKNTIPDAYKKVGELADGESLILETKQLSKSGEMLAVEIKFCSYSFQGDGRIMAVVSDISSRNMAVENLKISEERLALAVMDKDNGIWDWNIGSGKIYFSENWRKFIGLKKDDSTRGFDVWKTHIHPSDVDRVIDSMRKHWNGKSGQFMEEHRLLNKNGSYAWVLSRGKAVWNDAGEVVRMAGSLTNISEKKLLESQVIQMQKMEGLDRFAGGVAHDLNNMVMVINSYSRFIREAAPENVEIGGFVREIQQATERSSSLVKQLMAFSRKNQIQLEYVFLNLELEEILPMVKSVLGKNIELEKDFDDNLPPILADQPMISQLVLNLAINSRDAMPEGGKLTIETSAFNLDEPKLVDDRELKPGKFLRLSVSDNGIGMDELTVEKIFEPFFTTKHDSSGHGGAGLGLSTVYGIMKQHRGWVSVKSRPGIGTRFDLFFPLLNEASN
jgi:two-component system, cell cycle sensor histidine kinase and response regulator CckA